MTLVMFASVVQRYLFQVNFIWQTELVRYLHALIFMLASAYTLQKDEHVRVDMFYHKASPRYRAWVDICGALLCLIPVCISITWFAFDFIIGSWKIFEASPEYGGLPGVFILKTSIWVFSASLFFQAIAMIITSIRVIRS